MENTAIKKRLNTYKSDGGRLTALSAELKEQLVLIDEQYVTFKNYFFGKSSEREPEELLTSIVLHTDETRQQMLEVDEKSNWYLWGFSNAKASYFDIRDTRSRDVASALLKESACEFLVRDVFSGYAKAVMEASQLRHLKNAAQIKNAYYIAIDISPN